MTLYRLTTVITSYVNTDNASEALPWAYKIRRDADVDDVTTFERVDALHAINDGDAQVYNDPDGRSVGQVWRAGK